MADSHVTAPIVEQLIPAPDPARSYELLQGLPYRLFLDSAAKGTRFGRYSFLTADPIAVVCGNGPSIEQFDPMEGVARMFEGDVLQAVKLLIEPHMTAPVPQLPPFQGGLAGYLGYDWGRVLEQVPATRYDDLALPDVVLGLYDWVIAWDHEMSAAWLISTGLPETSPADRRSKARERADGVRKRLQSSEITVPARRSEGSQTRPLVESAPAHPVRHGWWRPELEIASSFSRSGYLDAVSRVREYILAGDIFQANLSQRFETRLAEPAWTLFCRLRKHNPAPFGAFLDFPDVAVISASPERFLQMDAAGHVETRPIKGTRPRGMGPEHDAALGAALMESSKDRAENLMIVDLMRNDLSRVCEPGTVHVTELFGLEHYATVHHLVSTVTGTIAPGLDGADLLRATFPGGSITGAPKVRAMEIIAELEPCQRGVYCGAIGYWSLTGALDMSMAIRTAVGLDDRIYFGAGGAIVADSEPEQEYCETLHKARGFIDAIADGYGAPRR